MFHVIIPARHASTRLPGKPLLEIAGKPMIRHVWEQALKSQARSVTVATDDQRIADACHAFGAEVVMTRADHPSGTDRLQEVVASMQLAGGDCVVNVQGDEPLIPPSLIDQVAANLLAHPQASIATLAEPLTDIEAIFNPNVVKLVTDHQGFALYFSRAPIPWCRDSFAQQPREIPQGMSFRRHIGLYAYKVDFLHDYVRWAPSPLETAESLEQLRALWSGCKIQVSDACETPAPGIDTLADLERVRAIMAER